MMLPKFRSMSIASALFAFPIPLFILWMSVAGDTAIRNYTLWVLAVCAATSKLGIVLVEESMRNRPGGETPGIRMYLNICRALWYFVMFALLTTI